MPATAPQRGRATAGRYVMSIDVGGTFTDFVLFDTASGEVVGFHKLLTDPQQPARPVIRGDRVRAVYTQLAGRCDPGTSAGWWGLRAERAARS
jgi:N-methylhydantoinase A/oxoprolinase/acetone carboxylase beta subunit